MIKFIAISYKKTSVWMLIIAAISALSVTYVAQSVAITEMVYQTASLEQQTGRLASATEQLQWRVASNTSNRNFTQLAQALGFKKIHTMQYIQANGTQVAQSSF